MLKEALEFLVGVGKQAAEVRRVDLPGNKLLLSVPGEDLIEVEKDSERLSDTVVTLSDLVVWITENTSAGDNPAVFVWDGVVHAVASRLQLHNRMQCEVKLQLSEPMKALSQWIGTKGQTQQGVVRWLRGSLGGCFDESVLRVFRRLDFARLAAANLSHTSLGRSVEEKAQSSAGEVPEHIVFKLPFYDLPHANPVNLLCAVEIDSATQAIAIFPVGDAINEAKRESLFQIQSFLDTVLPDWVTVYAGKAGYLE